MHIITLFECVKICIFYISMLHFKSAIKSDVNFLINVVLIKTTLMRKFISDFVADVKYIILIFFTLFECKKYDVKYVIEMWNTCF